MKKFTNYFEFYDIPLSFFIDKAHLKKKFYDNMKMYHPDFHSQAPEEKQKEILQLSSLNNTAYQTLNDDEKRLEYILSLFFMLHEDKYSFPQEFLMEMMELNEQMENPSQIENVLLQVNKKEQLFNQELSILFQQFDNSNTFENKDILLIIKELYFKNKYLLRIKEKAVSLQAFS